MRGDMSTKWRDMDIRKAAVLISLLLSVWHIAINPIPNTDAFTYIRTAQIYVDQGVAAAFQWYPTASFPVLMGMIHRVFGIDLILSGQLLNALLFAGLVYAFISLVLEARNTRRVALIAAIVILVFPSVNEYRYYLIRDIGFLAFAISGALQLCRYSKSLSLQHLGGFIAFTLLAALFRAEALAYLPLAPLALLMTERKQLRIVLKFELSLLVLGLIVLAIMNALNAGILDALQRMIAVYLPFLKDALNALSAENSPLAIAIFGEYAANFSGEYLWLFMLTGMSAILVMKLIVGFGGPTLLIFLYAYKADKLDIRAPGLRVTLTYCAIAFVILLSFLALTRFLSSRYTLMFCVSLLPLLVLTIDKLIEPIQQSPHRKLLQGALGALLLFSAVDAHISFGDSERSLDEGVAWLKENTEEGDSVFTNSNYVAYFSGRVANYDTLTRYISAEDVSNTPYGTILVLTTGRVINDELAHNLEFQQIELLAAYPDAEDPDLVIYRRLGN